MLLALYDAQALGFIVTNPGGLWLIVRNIFGEIYEPFSAVVIRKE